MESLQHLQSRLSAVKNVGKITKAMEVVSATKMRKSQEVALRTRPFAFRVLEILERIVGHSTDITIPLSSSLKASNLLILVIASDRGLAGSFNSQITRALEKLLETQRAEVIVVGRRALNQALRQKITIVEEFSGFGDFVGYEEVEPIINLVIEGFQEGKWSRVITLSTHFRSTLKQDVIEREILPVHVDRIQETVAEIIPEEGKYSKENKYNTVANGVDYIFEPSREIVLEALIPYLVGMQIYHLVLEANASEHSARMVAMKTASENSEELSTSLLLQYNKARQSGITREMVEITSTQTAL